MFKKLVYITLDGLSEMNTKISIDHIAWRFLPVDGLKEKIM
ncbi:MAG: hypothetical protein ABEJ72_03990 [Candidatus Aenigmatarchaeota archaeon]